MDRQNVLETYTWRTVKNRQEELLAGDRPVGSLVWRGWFSLEATATVGENQWIMDRFGFWRQRVEVRPAGAAGPEAIYKPRWMSSGALSLPGGRTYGWKNTSFWATHWEWQKADGTPVMHFTHRSGFFRQYATAQPLEPGLEPRELALLLALGWYLISLYYRDTAAVVAATAGGAS